MSNKDLTFRKLDEANDKVKAKRAEIQAVLDEAGPEKDMSKVKSLDGTSADKVAWIKARHDELNDLAGERDGLKTLWRAAVAVANGEADAESGADAGEPRSMKSLGRQFVESDAFRTKGASAEVDVDLKTVMSTSAGWAPQAVRGPRVVDYATRPVQVVDLVPQTTTTQNAIVFMEETTYTNNAAETAEAAAMPEAALVLTERTSTVRKIPITLPVTDEQFEDIDRMAEYLDNRLPFMVRQRLDLQILAGAGTGVNLTGVANVAGIQTQAKSTDPAPDAVLKAAMKVEVVGQAMADAAVFHPYNWQDVRLLRTADGIYIFGSPDSPGPERIFGLRVARCQAATQGTAIVGDFGNFSELATKKGMTVQYGYVNDDFSKGKQTVRAEVRVAFVVYRPAAFCTVTGL